MKKIIMLNAIIPLFFMVGGATAGAPMNAVETGVHEVLATLRTSPGQAPVAESVKKEKIRSVADSLFDYQTLSAFTLGSNWKKLSGAQQQEFINLYRQLLEQVYMGRILGYTDQEVDFEKETLLPNNRAEVSASIITSTGKIPMVYRMLEDNGKWKVYDVVIEGISIVRNYRAQFQDILANNSPQGMLDILRKKVSSQ